MSNDYRAYVESNYNSIYHHGVKGMRWGIRRYQNPDGTLTPEGRKRYFNPDGSLTKAGKRELKRRYNVKSTAGLAIGGVVGTSIAKNIGKVAGSQATKKELAELNKLKELNPEKRHYEFAKPNGKYDFVKMEKPGALKKYSGIKYLHKFLVGSTDDKGLKMKDVLRNVPAETYEKLSPEEKERWKKEFGKPIKRFDKIRVDADRYDALQKSQGHNTVDLVKQGYRKREFFGRGDAYNKSVSKIAQKQAKRGKIIAAAIIAAGAGATALAIYNNEKRKRQMAETGQAEVTRMLKGQSSSLKKSKKSSK